MEEILKMKKTQDIFDTMVMHLNKLKEMSCNKNNNETMDISFQKDPVIERFHKFITMIFDGFLHCSVDEFTDMSGITSDLIKKFDELFSSKFTDEDMMNEFLNRFKCALKTQEKLQCIEIKKRIQTLQDCITEIAEAQRIEHIQNIQKLAEKLLELFQLLLVHGKNVISQLLKEKINLYIHQLYISFEMFINLVKEQHKLKLPIFHTKKYLCDRIHMCLDRLNEVLDAPHLSIEEEDCEKSNHFVYKMDSALDLITELMNKNQEEQIELCKELWPAIEEVFSYAMSIAQVCQPKSFEEVTNICQIIVTEYENLKNQLASVPRELSLNGLFMKTTTDALYRLERQINISVLTLVKDVFSDPFCTLAKIIDLCGSSLPPERRNRSDIATHFENFDEISDEIMQIGFYAMACCRDVNRVAKIRNIMASLESTELELIPAITMFYLNPQNKELRVGAKLLTDQWQKDLHDFRIAVEIIIDPAAFAEIVLEDLDERVRRMNYCLDHHIPLVPGDVKTFVLRACTLAMQISLTIKDIGEDKVDKKTLMMIRELKTAVYEVSTAEKRFHAIIMTDPEQLRIIKRCELLINVVSRLQPALVTLMNNWDTENNEEESLTSLKNSNHTPANLKLSVIKTPYTVKSCKLPISIQSPGTEEKSTPQRSCLMPYIKQGRSMRVERSIMYRNPPISSKRSSINPSSVSKRNLSCVRQHLFSRDSNISSQLEEVNWTNISYDLSCILSELSSNSLENSEEMNAIDKINSLTLNHNDDDAEDNGDAPSSIDTPQRIADIQELNKKIDILQKSHDNN